MTATLNDEDAYLRELEGLAGDVRFVFSYTGCEIITLLNGWWLWRFFGIFGWDCKSGNVCYYYY